MWSLTVRAEDGRHYHVYNTRDEAFDAMASTGGFDRATLAPDDRRAWTSKIDDWGRRLTVEECPEGIKTVEDLEALVDAYDARECGEATAEQLELLNRLRS
jgi:hypothetical protein